MSRVDKAFLGLSGDELVNYYYEEHYQKVHGSGFMGKAADLQHVMLEIHRKNCSYPVTLELGSGHFQHYGFVRHNRDRYICSDIRVPTKTATYDLIQSGRGPRDLEFIEADASHIPLESHSVDRIVATCLLVHLSDPLKALTEWQRVCKKDGVIDFLIPCEGGLALRVYRKIVSERSAQKRGVPSQVFRTVNALDHKSSFERAIELTKYGIQEDRVLKVRFYPLRFLPFSNLNLFAVVSLEPK